MNNGYYNSNEQSQKGQESRVRGYGMGRGNVMGAASPHAHLPNVEKPQQVSVYQQPGVTSSHRMHFAQAPLQQRRQRSAGFWVAIVVALICIVLAIILVSRFFDLGISKRAGESGQLEGKTEAEIQAELDRQVEDGMFNISIASNIQFDTGTSEGELRIENVPNNPYLMQVTITRDDTGQQIYQTDLIEPNHHIQRDTLDVDLDPGIYECTATFAACSPETEELVGQAAAKVTIQVLG